MSNRLHDERRGVSIQSVDRALQMLRSFQAPDQTIGVHDFAKMLGVHKTTASRLTATLSQHGLIEREAPGEPFRLGPEVRRLGTVALGAQDLATQARPGMERLAAETGETVTLGVADGHWELRVIGQVNSRYVVGVTDWVGLTTPLHTTSDGKIVLAFGDVEPARTPLEPRTERTITDPAELARQIDRIRREGWASAIGEFEEGLNGVAAPILDGSGRLRAALSLSGPTYRCPPDRLPELATACRAVAASISARLETRMPTRAPASIDLESITRRTEEG
jgi:IclR family acetate operon transcriptional repressor